MSNLVYGVNDKPGLWKTIVLALQQVLAILAATIVVPVIINGNMGLSGAEAMSQSAALLGAGVGTLIYLVFTKFKSPVFLGSSFAFIGSMCAAFAGATSAAVGYIGIIIGAIFAGLVYVIIALVVKFVGVNWINKLMPASVRSITRTPRMSSRFFCCAPVSSSSRIARSISIAWHVSASSSALPLPM